MEERILAVNEMFLAGIDKELFFKLILHSTDGYAPFGSAYQNDKTISEWVELYNREDLNFGVSEVQIQRFFEYMSVYNNDFFNKGYEKYSVSRNLTNENKREDRFYFELILLTTFAII